MPIIPTKKPKHLVILSIMVIVMLPVLQLASTYDPITMTSSPDPITSVDMPGLVNASAQAGVLVSRPETTPTPTPLPNHYIWVPWRSQFDGSNYQSANCGPASLGMAMAYYGEWWSTDSIRKSTNERSGMVGWDDGTDWPSLAYAAEQRDFSVGGLYDSAGNYHQWTIDDLANEADQQHPVILLVRQRALPGHEQSSYYGDHYILFLGLMADGRVVYHDPAFDNETDGSYRIVSQQTLLEAWGDTYAGLSYTAMSVVWEHGGRKWDDPASTSDTPTPEQHDQDAGYVSSPTSP